MSMALDIFIKGAFVEGLRSSVVDFKLGGGLCVSHLVEEGSQGGASLEFI